MMGGRKRKWGRIEEMKGMKERGRNVTFLQLLLSNLTTALAPRNPLPSCSII